MIAFRGLYLLSGLLRNITEMYKRAHTHIRTLYIGASGGEDEAKKQTDSSGAAKLE